LKEQTRRIRKGLGVPFTIWLGEIPDDIKKTVRWKAWRDFYNDDMTPTDAMIQIRR